MVRVNLTRQAYEVVDVTNPTIAVTRQAVEVMANSDTANAARVNLTRMAYEMIFETPSQIAVTRQSVEVMANSDTPNAVAVSLTRMSYETITALFKRIAITRQAVEVMANSDTPNAATVSMTRMAYEVLSRKGPNPVVPLALADEVDFFMHNWATQAVLESAWITDVQQSAANGAEERRGLSLKPLRSLTFVWLIESREEADRMLVRLRKMSQARFQMPLYMDQTSLTASAASGTSVISLDTTKARFFAGARVAIVKRGTGATPISVQYNTISTYTLTDMQLGSNLTSDVDSSYVVIPMIDCEIMLTPKMQWIKSYGAEVKLTSIEVPGASQLPARGSGDPLGYDLFENKPIFNIEPNWVSGVDVGIDHQGENFNAGRATNVYTVGDRGRMIASYDILAEREDAWSMIEFWETRRGRLRSFFLIDRDQVWEASLISGVFVEISPLGSFAEFQEEMDYIGIVMKDGTQYVRDVITIQSVLGIWRVTVGSALPAINLNDIARIARARIVRFDSDSVTESWTTDNVMTTQFDFIECLNEGDVEL